MPHFFLLSSHPRFYWSWSLSLLRLLGKLSQRREKVCTIFICFFFVWGVGEGSLHCSWCTGTCYERSKCLYCRDTTFELCFTYFLYYEPKYILVKKWFELFTICNVFCMQAWQFRNFQIRASLCSPCHYIFRAHTTKKLKLATPSHCRVLFVAVSMFTRRTLDVQRSVLDCQCSSSAASTGDGFPPISFCPLPVVG